MMRRDPGDRTRVTEQPALTTSSGRIWLVMGGLFALASVVVLAFLTAVHLAIAVTGIVLVVALYAAMVLVRVTVAHQRRRLVTLAWLMGTMAAIALACVIVVGESLRF